MKQKIYILILLGILFASFAVFIPIQEYYYGPVWSFDSSHLAFRCYHLSLFKLLENNYSSKRNGDIPYDVAYSEVCIIVTGNAKQKQITRNYQYEWKLKWSPTNLDLSFITYNQSQRVLAITQLDSSSNIDLIDSTVGILDYSWSPNGNNILYSTDDGDNDRIRVYELESGIDRLLVKGETLSYPSWSPNINLISFVERQFSKCSLHIKNIETGEVILVSNLVSCDLSPTWSLDGKKLGFVSAINNELSIYTISSKTIEVIETPKASAFHTLTWMKDGMLLGIIEAKLVIYDPVESKIKEILSPQDQANFNLLSLDQQSIDHKNNRIAITNSSLDGKSASIWIVDVDGKKLYRITR